MEEKKKKSSRKGIPNKSTQELREKMSKLLELTEEEIIKSNDIKMLKPNERVDFYCKLMSYLCPKPVEKDSTNEAVKKLLTSFAMVNSSL